MTQPVLSERTRQLRQVTLLRPPEFGLTRFACFFWLICMGHRTNRDAWVDARRQAGHEVVVDAAPAEKPGTEQDW